MLFLHNLYHHVFQPRGILSWTVKIHSFEIGYVLNDKETGVQFSTRVQNFSCWQFSAQIFGLRSFLTPVGRGFCILGKVICVEADHSLASNFEVVWVSKCTSDSPSCSSVSSLVERNKLTFTFTIREKRGIAKEIFLFLRLLTASVV